MSLSTPTPRMRLKPGRRQVVLGVALLLVLAHHVQGRAYMRSPAARNVVALGAYKTPWELDAFDGGGPDVDQASGHGLCGGLLDDPTKTMLESGDWVSDVQTTYLAGGVLTAEIVVTEHRGGHLEMRLCELDEEANVTTQNCLNEHVLEYELTAVVTSYSDDMPYNLSSPADYSALPDELQCENIADRGPRGLCCRQGGKCSPESSNVDRWVLPEANTLGPHGASLYSIAFRLPANVTCAHCVLQMAIVDAPATAGEFPSATYNCADVAIEADEQETLSGLSTVASGAIAGSGGFLVLASLATLVWMRRRSYNEEDAESRFFGRSFTFTTGTNSVLTASLPRSLPHTESGRSAKLSLASRFRLSASSPRATAQVSSAGSSSRLPRGIMPEVEISNPAHGTTTAQATTAGSSSPLPRGLMPEVEIPPSVAPPSTPSVNIANRPRTPSFRLPSFLQSRGPSRLPSPPSPLFSSPPPGMNPPRRDNKAYRFSIDSDDV